jgi:hypothetical protein
MIALDNFIGQALFSAWSITERVPALTQLWLRAWEYELSLPNEARRYRRALWNMFTGDDSYWHIFLSLVDPRVFWFFLKMIRRLCLQRNLCNS